MYNVAFLVYFPDPFETGAAQFMILNGEGIAATVSIEQLKDSPAPLVTYDVPGLVDELRRYQISPPVLIDVGDALRLGSGLSRDQGGERKWNIWRSLAPYFKNKKDRDSISAIVQSRQAPPSGEAHLKLLSASAWALRGLWEQLLGDLEASGEIPRLMEVEIPVQQIFWYRQYKGIRVNTERANELIEGVKKEKYDAFRLVASVLGFSPSGLKFSDLDKYIDKTDARHLKEFSGTTLFREYFRIARFSSTFARAYWQYDRSARDLSILKRIYGGGEKVFPIFQPFGTVTGRVLVSEPRLQELQKKYRAIIDADGEKELVYLDYSQYEPGILGALSGDQKLIDLYNSTDLYSALSEAIFGNGEQRSICKRIFLGFCYGMQRQNIAKLLAGADADASDIFKFESVVKDFFDEFPHLEEYKKTLESKLQDNGYISSIYGNRRIRNKNGALTNKERRWSISQVVQGTASLIFKEAVINLAAEFGKDSILLPMHDAVLMQFGGSAESINSNKHRAAEIMTQSFSKWIKNVEPKVIEANYLE